MKKILLILLLASLFTCQIEKKESVAENTVVKEYKPEKKNEVFIGVHEDVHSFFTNLFLDEMQDRPDMLDLGQKKNKLSVVIPTAKTIVIRGGIPMYSFFYEQALDRGDSLFINTEKVRVNQSTDIDYPIFSIANRDVNWNELNFGYLLYKSNIRNNAIVIDLGIKFRNNTYNVDKVYQNAIELLDSLKATESISNDFYEDQKTIQKLKTAAYKLREARQKNKELDIERLGIQVNDDGYLHTKEFISYIRALVLYKYFKTAKRIPFSTQFDYIYNHDTIFAKKTRETLLDSYLKSIFFVEKSKFKEYLNKFDSINTNEEYRDRWRLVTKNQEKNSKKLNQPNRTIGMLTNLVNYSKLTFDDLLKKHKGRLVLIDFWASWCAPCREEMPNLKQLKSKFKESDLKIVEISIDEDYSAWERASKLEGLAKEEDNYIIADWKNTNLYKTYKISTIPRYLLFGKDGRIIDQDAPRPSNIELEELIRANL